MFNPERTDWAGPGARGLMALALLAALAFGAAAPVMEVPDSASYLGPARSWAAGQGLRESDGSPLSYRLPAFPVMLGVCIRVFGDTPRGFGLMNVFFLIVAAMMVRSVLRPAAGTVVADLGAAATLVYPPLLGSTALVLQEVFLASLIAALFVVARHAVAQSSVLLCFLAGAILGLAALAKPTSLVATPFLLFLVSARGPARFRRGASVLVAAALVLAPWAAASFLTQGSFNLGSGNGGHTLLGGTVSNRIEDWSSFPEYQAAVRDWQAGGQAEEPVLDRYLTRTAVRRIIDDPARWLALCAERVARFMLPARTWFVEVGLARSGAFGPVYILGTAFSVSMFFLTAWLGVQAARRRDPAMALGPALVFSHMLVYVVTYVSPRYAVTIAPVLIASSALALVEIRLLRRL